jgi:hypothetical protein
MPEKKNYIFEDWWTDSQIELVKNSSRIWEKKRFKVVPGFWILKDGAKVLGKLSQHEHLPEGAILDNTAWDHEHCELCWMTISEHAGHQQEGYTDGKEWLCVECHDKYITPVRTT